MRFRRTVIALALLLLLVVVVGALAAVPGRYDTVPRPLLGRTAPAWSKPCAAAAVLRVTWSLCGRVKGRAVWVENEDADGDGDRHVVLLAHGHVRVVKISRSVFVRRNPRIGDRLEAVGAVTKGARTESEIDAQKVVLRGAAGL